MGIYPWDIDGGFSSPPRVRNPRLTVRCEYPDTTLESTEVQLACRVLNTMTGLGMPESRPDFGCTSRLAQGCL